MTDERIKAVFEKYGQFVTGKDCALIRAIAEAVAPQRKPLTDEQYFEIGQRHWLSSSKVEQIHKELEEAAHGIKEKT